MKVVSFILLAVFNIAFIFAKPAAKQTNNYFTFEITDYNKHECTITGLDKYYKGRKNIDIPSYFMVDDERYDVTKIAYNAFKNETFEEATIKRGPKTLYLSNYSFGYNKSLKKVNVEHLHIEMASYPFGQCNSINFDGRGIPNLVQYLCEKKLSQWGLPIDEDGYDEAGYESREKKMKDLYRLAKKIKGTYTTNANGNGNNLASILIQGNAYQRGYHMLFRQFAIVMGVDENHIFTAADNHCGFWTYVRFDRDKYYDDWWNVDISVYDFNKYKGDKYPSEFYMRDSVFADYLEGYVNHLFKSEVHHQPSKWVIYPAVYGTDHEKRFSEKFLIDELIEKYGGIRAK